MKVSNNGNFIANGIIVKNCDALRYAVSPFMKSGTFSSPDEELSHAQLMKKVYGNDHFSGFQQEAGGYY